MNTLDRIVDASPRAFFDTLIAIYEDLHRNPELSMQEVRTAAIAAEQLRRCGFDVTTGIGGTGVAGVLRNGDGPTVLLRADMDALPITEATGATYASVVSGVAHACGHDLHVTWLLGAAQLLAEHRAAWRGTLIAVFQPGEELGVGAAAMMDDGMAARFPKPDIVLGQHVMVGPAGSVSSRGGTLMAAGDSFQVRLFGRGAHGAQPQNAIDPVVMAAATVMRLQTVVSREVSPQTNAVVTVGALHAGTKENIIPDEATLKLNVRTYDEDVRSRVIAAVQRICRAECVASGAPREPEFTPISRYPVTANDEVAALRVLDAFAHCFGRRLRPAQPVAASEDFGVFGTRWGAPSVFWFVGGTDPDEYARAKAAKQLHELPGNHSPRYLPVLEPTLQTGVTALLAAAGAWLCARAPV